MQNRLVDSYKLNRTVKTSQEYKSVINSYKGEFKLDKIFNTLDEKVIINRLINSKNGTTEDEVKTNKDILLLIHLFEMILGVKLVE